MMKLTRPPAALGHGHSSVVIATFLWTGLLPKAPGTWGSLAAALAAAALTPIIGHIGLLLGAVFLFLIGLKASADYENALIAEGGGHDPGAIVIDEAAAQFLVLAAIPFGLIEFAAGFVLFRLFDVVKIWPASLVDKKYDGALGVMADDVVAALYAILVFHLAAAILGG